MVIANVIRMTVDQLIIAQQQAALLVSHASEEYARLNDTMIATQPNFDAQLVCSYIDCVTYVTHE